MKEKHPLKLTHTTMCCLSSEQPFLKIFSIWSNVLSGIVTFSPFTEFKKKKVFLSRSHSVSSTCLEGYLEKSWIQSTVEISLWMRYPKRFPKSIAAPLLGGETKSKTKFPVNLNHGTGSRIIHRLYSPTKLSTNEGFAGGDETWFFTHSQLTPHESWPGGQGKLSKSENQARPRSQT